MNIVLCGKRCNEVKVPEKMESFFYYPCQDVYPYQRDTKELTQITEGDDKTQAETRVMASPAAGRG